MNPSYFTTIIDQLYSLYSQINSIIVNNPVVQGTMGTSSNSSFIRTALGAFAGSSSAGAIYIYFREKLYLLPLKFRRNHTIVCGLNYHSLLILRDLAGRKQKPVIIERNGQNNYLESCRLEGITAIVGDPADRNILARAGLKKARYIFIFDENDETNAEITLLVMQMIPRHGRQKITPVIQIFDPRLYMIIRKQTFSRETGPSFHIEFFNRYALGAKLILDRHPPICAGMPGSGPYPVIVFGGGNLGEMIIASIARSWYDKQIFTERKPQIFLVDPEAETICEKLRLRHIRLNDVCDLVPVAVDVRMAESGGWTFLENPALENGFSAYICFNEDSLGLYTASSLARIGNGRRVQIVVEVEHSLNLARLIADEQKTPGYSSEILPVDMNLLTADSVVIQAGEQELIARAIHEFYCSNQKQGGETVQTNRLLVPWDELGALTRKKDGIDGKKIQESNRNQARMIWNKLNSIGCDIGPITDWEAPKNFRFTAEEIESLAAVEHERWMQEKLAEGWHYGPVRDDRKRDHPSIIPYKDLSESEKEKDRFTITSIPHILSLIDFQIYRKTPAKNPDAMTGISLGGPGLSSGVFAR